MNHLIQIHVPKHIENNENKKLVFAYFFILKGIFLQNSSASYVFV